MSYWKEHDIETKILAILGDVPEHEEGHHLGRPFLSAYQIAIELDIRYPEVVKAFGKPIGGLGTGQRYSLSTYIAKQLSDRIRDKRIPVEGGFISNWHLNDIYFNNQGEPLQSSLTGSGFTLSMFRLI